MSKLTTKSKNWKFKEVISMLRMIKKILKGLGVELEADQMTELAEELQELTDAELAKKAKQSDGSPSAEEIIKSVESTIVDAISKKLDEKKPSDDESKSELERVKAEYEKELEGIKLQTKIDAELASLKIAEGYLDVVKGLVDFEKVALDKGGNVTGLKEQTEKIAKDKPLLFGNGKQSYDPPGGGRKEPETNIEKAMKNDKFNFTEFIKNKQESEE